jgi:exopolysaccharide biosynthesis polyprenyl glycosylphosphotransferase
MTRERFRFIRHFLLVSDLLLTSVSFLLSYIIRDALHTYYKFDLLPYVRVLSEAGLPPFASYTTLLLYVVPIWGVSLICKGLYREPWSRRGVLASRDLVEAGIWATLLTICLFYLLKLPYLGRSYILIFSLLNLGCLYLYRRLYVLALPRLLSAAADMRFLLIVGCSESARAFADRIARNAEWHTRVLGFLSQEPSEVGSTINNVPVLGTVDMVGDCLHRYVIDEVVFAVPRNQLEILDEAIHRCEVAGVRAVILANLFDARVGRLVTSDIAGWPVLMIDTVLLKEWERLAKRLIDLIGAGVAICLTAPVMLCTAAAIRLTSPGPIFFRQERVGLHGRRFTLYKFRTMVADAERYREALQAMNEMDGPVFKMARDPRVTKIGRLLRRSSLDELPQLFNVLRGDMSLVGPRPPIPAEVVQYEPWQRRRLSVRPGITCVWQVNGRNKLSFAQWMAMDLEYIDHWSLWLDLKLMMQTIPAVLKGEGAR